MSSGSRYPSQDSTTVVMNQVTPNPKLDLDDSTVSTATTSFTPSETINDDLDSFGDVNSSTSSTPSDGSTFIIRSVSCGRVITLLYDKVSLSYPDDRGSMHWECVETGGWFGFRNCVTGNFLGYDKDGTLCCSAKEQKNWENFHYRWKPEGGFVLLMSHVGSHWKDLWYGRELWHVGVKMENGVEKLAKMGPGGSGGLAWEFSEVYKNRSYPNQQR